MGKINKSTIETVKTVLIAVLITAIVAFTAGMYTHAKMNSNADARVKGVVVETLSKDK